MNLIFAKIFSLRRRLLAILILSNILQAQTNDSSMFSMSFMESKEFLNLLNDAIDAHPKKSIQLSLIAQEESQVEIIKSDKGFKSYLQIDSRAKPMDTEYDSIFQSLQQKDTVTTDQTVVIEKLLTDFGTTKSRITEYENIVQFQSSLSENEISKLALSMIDICYETAVNTQLKQVADISYKRHAEIHKLIGSRVESGRAAGRELSRSAARLAESEATKILIENRLLASQSRFKSYYANDNYCQKLPSITFSIVDGNTAIELAMQGNSEINALEYQIKAVEAQIATIQKSRRPTIKGQFTSNKTDISNTDDYILVGGITFNWPLYQGKRTVYQKRKANHQLDSVKFELAAKKLDIQSLIESNLADISQSKLQEQALMQAFSANATSVEQLNAQFFSANVSLLELLQAERDYIDAAQRYLSTAKELRMSQFLHLFYTGRLNDLLSQTQ